MMEHPYANDVACVQRLYSEWKEHGSLVIAFDFDNTVYDYHGKGHDYSEVIDLLKQAYHEGFTLICFTAKELNELKGVADHLKRKNIPYSRINENPDFFKAQTKKIYYNLLLDDRAGLGSAIYQLQMLLKLIREQI